jgi:hypothetical protein
MDIDKFWAIVDKYKDGEYPGVGVDEELTKLTPEEIVSYETHSIELVDRAYCWPVWGAAFIMSEGHCSDDMFTDFRYGLIARGREVYQAVLADPDSLADLPNDWIGDEDFSAMAWQAYEAKTNEELPWSQIDRPSEPSGEKWDFNDHQEACRRLPRMWAKYGQQFQHPIAAADKKPWWKFW